MTLFIGDVHGKFYEYKTILENNRRTIQVGDFGVGFVSPFGIPLLDEPPWDRMWETNARFIRGNHDNPGECKKWQQWIPDGHVEGDMMFVGGALSIDRHMRTLNEDYWEEEELSYKELSDLQVKYLDTKPRIMVTHDCPDTVANYLFNTMKLSDPSRTRQAFDAFFEGHKPEIWIFGHWHDRRDMNVLGTRFICLEELGTIEI